ncbi:DMT family transporter [Noviherbaspirillum galbum]|uniref:DMT family transporter n=1 Tax=Noviherbaspirillum galbum TaxID=2709383 RepID=A0A6B3SP67_9BURK|nr:DMT family transporter [Noviherbaspirillum galbum]NEX62543.1 DMT family transporter [Noviherbaspirillum galbum]
MDARKAVDGQAIGIMVMLCMIWGLQQVVLKATVDDISPTLQVALRSGIAALLLMALMRIRKERIALLDGPWRAGLLAGGLFASEYLFVCEALRHTSAAHAVVFLYTGPIFAALGLHWKLPSERLAPIQWAGIAVAFAGIFVAFLGKDQASWQPSPGDSGALWGDFLALGAGAALGSTTVAIRCSGLAQSTAKQTLLYQLVVAFLILLAVAAFTGELGIKPTAGALESLVFQTVIVSFASFLAWFWLLRQYLASRLGVFSFMTPMFGVMQGAWLLGEDIESRFLAGALLVLAGIAIVSSHGWRKPA